MKKLYLVLAVLGLVLPYTYFVPFLVANGLDLALFSKELFANQISSFFAADLFVSSLVFWVFLYRESTTHRIRWWWLCLLANLTVGLSLALPLLLYFREAQRERSALHLPKTAPAA
jgi:hypothetical protein